MRANISSLFKTQRIGDALQRVGAQFIIFRRNMTIENDLNSIASGLDFIAGVHVIGCIIFVIGTVAAM